jgi:hypothetical protein
LVTDLGSYHLWLRRNGPDKGEPVRLTRAAICDIQSLTQPMVLLQIKDNRLSPGLRLEK